jgi:hypothetical protein
VNEKSKVTQKRLHSEERKRRKALGITKEVAGQEKSTEKRGKQFQTHHWLSRRGRSG